MGEEMAISFRVVKTSTVFHDAQAVQCSMSTNSLEKVRVRLGCLTCPYVPYTMVSLLDAVSRIRKANISPIYLRPIEKCSRALILPTLHVPEQISDLKM
jgi:hypothetical protein